MKFLFLFLNIAYASNPDFTSISAGDKAPFEGVLLTEEALAKIISKNEREIEQCKIDAEFEMKDQAAKFQLDYDLLEVRYKSENKMYLDMIEVRDQQIKFDKKKDILQKWSTYGAFLLGVGTTIGISYAVNQNFN